MELRLLRAFRQVATDLNYSRAAEKLFVAQPALSRQIQSLEDAMGVRLFDRDKRTVRLTAAGAYLNEQLGSWFDTLDHLTEQAQRIHNGDLGDLRIGHPGSALYSVLPDALADFSRLYPGVVTSLREVNEVELQEALLQQKIDVGFVRELPQDPRLSSRMVLEEPFSLVLPRNHWLNPSTFTSLAQCHDEPFILPALGKSITYTRQLLSLFATHGYTPKARYESNYGATILRLVEKGLGLAVLPISYQSGTSLNLRFLILPNSTQLYLIWRMNDPNPVVNNFLAVCEQVAADWPVKPPELSTERDRFSTE
ncbi:LysR family transcriptional regulator [Fibrella aquatilis]|uniref:LysR family transcriptional regulator n=1 Tax=Fibrella aquatilis TaxID=2817059 RepID=A0A939GB67_9BACT|nr:LysR family transcriptional regulator [Fibrella aquatilis]MBO0933422.1 LysR family transcriptional regulator [Fibrella aquatilis]